MTTFRILGEVEVWAGEQVLDLGGPRQASLLAVLLVHANRPVAREAIREALEGDAGALSPEGLRMAVARLRKALEPRFPDPQAVLRTVTGGYALVVEAGALDADVFEAGVVEGRQALDDGQPARAQERLRAALELWRGAPLADVTYEEFAQPTIRRLNELHVGALEAHLDAEVQLGGHAGAIAELDELVTAHPDRERLAALLMLALYRDGRQDEALALYRRVHARRREDGLAPWPGLQALQQQVLEQDPGLELRSAVPLPGELDPAGEPALVGRRDELVRLQEQWRRTRAGQGALVVVSGPRGIGKTRLAAEVAREAHEQGASVLYAGAGGSVRAALDAASRGPGPALLVVDDVDRVAVRELATLVPRLAELPVLALVAGEDGGQLAALAPAAALRLGPLDADAVRAIAAGYWPSTGDVPTAWLLDAIGGIPVAWLLEASGGVPGRVHQVAGEWARDAAARLSDVLAGKTAASRSELRELEAQLAETLGLLQTARERESSPERNGAAALCPFKGLTAFDAIDAKYYFGRERLIAELETRLVGAPLLGIIGPSGSGKSSVLRAGLLPALASGVLAGSDTWTHVVIRPGEHPPRDLAERAGVGRFVLAVDQFEEVFTACRDQSERDAFIAELVGIATDRDRRGVVVLALRADQYGRCAEYPELSSLLAVNQVLVQPMRRDELRRAIERPAEEAGLRVEPALTDALVADVAGEPGALPLLSAALLELWQHRDGRHLRLAEYKANRGVRGAVARLAEDAFRRLDEAQQVVARHLLLRLVAEGDERAIERRRVALTDVDTDQTDVAHVLGLLADRRLLTISEGALEIAHEALLREWPRLADWIDEDREGLRVQRSLAAAAAEWNRLDRDAGALYRGTNLALALDWRSGHEPALTRLEREFLDASGEAAQAETAARRRRVRRVVAALSVALVAITAVALAAFESAREAKHQRQVAQSQTREAQRQRQVSLSRDLAANAMNLLGTDPGLSLALARRALEAYPTSQARAALRQAVEDFRGLAVLQVTGARALTADFSPDGSQILTAADGEDVQIWSLASAATAKTFPAGGTPPQLARFSPDGRTIATASYGRGDSNGSVALGGTGTVEIISIATGKSRTVVEHGAVPLTLEFSPDGQRLAVGFSDGVAEVVELGAGRPRTLRRVCVAQPDYRYLGVALSADRLAVADYLGETICVWNLAGDAPPLRIEDPIAVGVAVDISPYGNAVVAGGLSGDVTSWDLDSGKKLNEYKVGYGQILSAHVSDDGTQVVAAGAEGIVWVFDVMTLRVMAELRGHVGQINDAGFNATGDQLATAGADGTVRTWGLAPGRELYEFADNAALSPDGAWVAAGTEGQVRLRRVSDGSLEATLDVFQRTRVRFSPDSLSVIVAGDDGTVRIWNPTAKRAGPVYSDHDNTRVSAAAMDPAGRRIVSGGADGRVVVRGVDGEHEPEFVLDSEQGQINDVAFDATGQRLLSAGAGGTVKVWDAQRKGAPLWVLGEPGDPAVNAAAFDSEGLRVVSADDDGSIRVWTLGSAGSGKPAPSTALRGHTGAVASVAFDSTGDRIVSAGADGTVRVWSPRETAPLLTAAEHGARARSAAFDADGTQIISSGDDGVIRLAPCEACGSLEDVLAAAGTRAERPLTAAERGRFLGKP